MMSKICSTGGSRRGGHSDLYGPQPGGSTVDGDDPAAADLFRTGVPGASLRAVRSAGDARLPAAGRNTGAGLEPATNAVDQCNHRRRDRPRRNAGHVPAAPAHHQTVVETTAGDGSRGAGARRDYASVLIGFSGYQTSISGLTEYSASSARPFSQASTCARCSSLTEPRRARQTKP